MKINFTYYTDNGGRKINEDSLGVKDCGNDKLFVLCDGLGGHGMGDVASRITVDLFKSVFAMDRKASAEVIKKGFEASYRALLNEQDKLGVRSKMKTTAVALAINETNAFIGHIGDSRLYVFTRSGAVTRTRDHSIPQMLVLTGEITDAEIRKHPQRNMLLRVLGLPWDSPKYEISAPISLSECKAFLLCSDGFWELIDENTMIELLNNSSNVNEWLDKMISVVKTNGQNCIMDNNTAIVIWIE